MEQKGRWSDAKHRTNDGRRISGGKRWVMFRRRVLAEEAYICEDCKQSFIDNPDVMEVHHRKPLSEGGERFRRSNLMAICKPCHRVRTNELIRSQAKGRYGKANPERKEWYEFVDQLRA